MVKGWRLPGRGGELLRWAVAAMVFLLVAACSSEPRPRGAAPTAQEPSGPPPESLAVSAGRGSAGVVASGGAPAPYNYGPTVMVEDGRYRAWWCSQLPGVGPAGDDVLHAASGSPGSVFTAGGGAPAVPVFHGSPGGFDGMHTCDPSVIRVGGTYYLYYTGAAGDHVDGNAIGVASSPDGLVWRREARGEPVVTASNEVRRTNAYGAGQPSALHLDGWFHLMFTDTTAAGAGDNGAGQFVLRARDPEFTDRVQILTEGGFQPVGRTDGSRSRSVVDAFSADWMWVAALDAFAIAHQTDGGTTITFWDRGFTRHPYRPLLLPGEWREGPGLVREPDGSAPTSDRDPCGAVPIDVLRATTSNPDPTGLRHVGLDVVGVEGCAATGRARSVLDGFGFPSPHRTVDVLLGGKKVRVERRSVAEEMVGSVLDERVPAMDAVPVAGTIPARARALRAPDGSVGLLDENGRLWTVSGSAVEANGSVVADVSAQEWEMLLGGGRR